MTEPLLNDKPSDAAQEPRPWVRTFLADPFAYILLEDYVNRSLEDPPGALVERFRARFEELLAKPGLAEVFWLSMARAQMDRKILLVEVRREALAAASTVFERMTWEGTTEFLPLRKEQVAKLKAELEATEPVEDDLKEEDRHWNKAVGHGMAGRLDQALALAREGRIRWPREENFTLAEAQFLAEQDHPGKALEIARQALSRDLTPPARFAYLRLLGNLHLFLEERSSAGGARIGLEGAHAVEYLTEAQALDPGEPITLRLLAKAQMFTGKHKPALENFDRLLEMDAEDPWVWKQKGVVLEAMGRSKEAAAAYTKSVFFGGDAEALARQAWVFMKKGRFEDAERCFQQALELVPHYPWARKGRSLNRLARRGGWTGWMTRFEVFWTGRVVWHYFSILGVWLGSIIIASVLFPERNDPRLVWVIGVGGALMLAFLFLPGTWIWVATWRYEKEAWKEERQAVALKWDLKTLVSVVGGLLIAGVLIFLKETGILPKRGYGGPFDGAEYVLGPLLPFIPWIVTAQVLVNRRLKFSDLSWGDWALLFFSSVSLAGFIPFLWTRDTRTSWVWMSAVAGALGAALCFGIKVWKEKRRRK